MGNTGGTAQGGAETSSVISQGVTFVRESIGELKKVSHPTRQETMQATFVTIFILLFVAICLFLFDLLLGGVMKALIPTDGL